MTKQNIATEFAPGSEIVQLLDTGYLVERADAIARGYIVSPEATTLTRHSPRARVPSPQADETTLKRRAWRSSISQSPEAKDRDDATAEILVRHSPETLSVQDARAFLRGLPLEQPEPPKETTVTKTEDPRAAREAELAASMAAFNRERGYRAPRQAVAAAPSLAGVDPVKLKCLAELRLNALENGQAHASRSETNNLRYALQVHNTTGAPLTNVFAQLGINAATFVR